MKGSLWDISDILVLDVSAGLSDRFSCETSARCPFMVCVLFCVYILLLIKTFFLSTDFQALTMKSLVL